METKWLVWSPVGRAQGSLHHCFELARIEAERLAIGHPGQRFLVLQSVGECVRSEVAWTGHADTRTDIHEKDLPF